MKELRSRKKGTIHFISDEEYNKLLGLGIERRYIITDVEPVKQIKPPTQVVITKKKDNK